MALVAPWGVVDARLWAEGVPCVRVRVAGRGLEQRVLSWDCAWESWDAAFPHADSEAGTSYHAVRGPRRKDFFYIYM